MFSPLVLFGTCLASAVLGALLVWIWKRGHASPASIAMLQADLAGANVQADQLSANLDESKQAQHKLEQQLVQARQQREAASNQALELTSELKHLRHQLNQQVDTFNLLREQTREEFANISSKLLTQNSEQLRAAHSRSLQTMLEPLRVKLHEFQEQVDRKFSDESKDKASLKTQIAHLTELNQDLSKEARQLTQALKGDSKVQGDWGELQLERLLEAAGLQSSTHFDTQTSFRNAQGQQQRPDCIVHLPQQRCIVVDSKVSLTAYERFCGSDNDPMHLAEHVKSLRTHIKSLSAKRYQDLYQVNSPDYVLLFVPLEPAFIAAVRERPSLFTEALAANVVLVCPSTLLATMRTVAVIWQQEDQRENALKIAEVGKKLYEKFVGFVDDMNAVGQQLDRAKDSYDAAMNKLSRSPKQSTTLLARAQELTALGVASDKKIATKL